jgi:4-hydroxy-3-polyprenylbenzoate decarboxylase
MVSDSTPLILAVTGASGSLYAKALAEKIMKRGLSLHLLISGTAPEVFQKETGSSMDQWLEELSSTGMVTLESLGNLGASISSGSYLTRGMIIAPCSMGTLGRIAAGISGNLIERAADVCLKERRRLVLLTRESPLSAIHLENMLRLTHAGGVIMPPVPAFYTLPKNLSDIVDYTAERVMDMMGLPSDDVPRWSPGGDSEND